MPPDPHAFRGDPADGQLATAAIVRAGPNAIVSTIGNADLIRAFPMNSDPRPAFGGRAPVPPRLDRLAVDQESRVWMPPVGLEAGLAGRRGLAGP